MQRDNTKDENTPWNLFSLEGRRIEPALSKANGMRVKSPVGAGLKPARQILSPLAGESWREGNTPHPLYAKGAQVMTP